MRLSSCLAPLALVVLAACSGADGSSAPGTPSPSATPAAPVAAMYVSHEIPRGGASTASIQTLPNATCTLHSPAEPAGVGEHLTVFSDDEGIARVTLRHVDLGIDRGELALDCTDDAGTHVTHVIEVKIVDGAVAQAPLPFSRAGKPTLRAIDVDPMSLSAGELVARGYPPRPNPTTAPGPYAKWLSLVHASPTMVTPHAVATPTRLHGPARPAIGVEGTGDATRNGASNSNNWSGYVISTSAQSSQYGEIFGAWNVPRAYAESGFWNLNHSTLWVGMDGWGTSDVVQDGTDQDTETIFGIQASTYDAWTEWYPLSSQTISNFPVNPGDEMYVWCWVGTSAGAWTPAGGVGWFELWNVTENVLTRLSTAAPSGTTFNGHTAEWVMERPTVDGSLSTLANYESASLTDAWAYDFSDKTHDYTSDSSLQVTMTNGADTLSTVAPVSSTAMQFTWHKYQ